VLAVLLILLYRVYYPPDGDLTFGQFLDMSKKAGEQRALIARPRYANAAAWHHIRQSLLKTDDADERRRRFDGFVAVCGEGYGPGVRAQLATQGDREPYATLLAQLGGPPEVEPVEMHDLADRIDAMAMHPQTGSILAGLMKDLTDATLNPSDPIDRLRAEANDYLAIACMKRLLEGGDADHDLIRRYIDKRLGTAEHHGGELRKIRDRLPSPP
jgi:hypothetical protein